MTGKAGGTGADLVLDDRTLGPGLDGFQARLAEFCERRAAVVVLDWSAVRQVPARALAVLAAAGGILRAQGGRLVSTGVGPGLRRSLDSLPWEGSGVDWAG